MTKYNLSEGTMRYNGPKYTEPEGKIGGQGNLAACDLPPIRHLHNDQKKKWLVRRRITSRPVYAEGCDFA